MILQDMSVAITGAGSGLGAATARRFSKAGALVACLDLSETAARSIAAEVGGSAHAVDVSDSTAVEGAFRDIAAVQGTPRVVVNCAGIGTAARILPRDGSLTIDSFEQALRVNLLGTYTVMNIAARAMPAADPLGADGARGVIINTASVAFEDGQIGQAAYAASKGGIVSMTLPAATDRVVYGR